MVAINFPYLVLVTLFTIILTSSVSAKPDGTSPVSPVSRQDPTLKSSSSIVEHSPDINGKKVSSWGTSRMTEGGPISTNESTVGSDRPGESRARENIPKQRNANPSVVARKGVEEKGVEEREKIKPRKGVNQDMDPKKTNILFNQTTSKDVKPVVESVSTVKAADISSQPKTSNISTLKLNVTNSHSNNSLDHSILNSSYSNTTLIPTNVTSHVETTNNTTSETLHIEKHIPKPKPTVTTVDGPEIYESRSSSRRKNFSPGIPRKIDYIMPVIITIIALPILGAGIFVLYRRGRDCWDKRHYRRMDFLIDGMYND